MNIDSYTLDDLKYEGKAEPKSDITPPTPNFTYIPGVNEEKTANESTQEQPQINILRIQTNPVEEQTSANLHEHSNAPKKVL